MPNGAIMTMIIATTVMITTIIMVVIAYKLMFMKLMMVIRIAMITIPVALPASTAIAAQVSPPATCGPGGLNHGVFA